MYNRSLSCDAKTVRCCGFQLCFLDFISSPLFVVVTFARCVPVFSLVIVCLMFFVAARGWRPKRCTALCPLAPFPVLPRPPLRDGCQGKSRPAASRHGGEAPRFCGRAGDGGFFWGSFKYAQIVSLTPLSEDRSTYIRLTIEWCPIHRQSRRC